MAMYRKKKTDKNWKESKKYFKRKIYKKKFFFTLKGRGRGRSSI